MRGRWLCALALAGCGDARAPAAADGADGIDPSAGVPSSDAEEDDGGVADGGDWGGWPTESNCPAEPEDGASRSAVVADVAPPAVSGGTLVLRDGLAFVADPDRDEIQVVDLIVGRRSASISLPAGSEPGRIVEGANGIVHAVLRGAGAIVSVDPLRAEILAQHDVCANPRGLAIDEVDGSLVVACAEGVVARVDARGDVTRIDVGVELRDVVDVGPPLRVSAYRSAEVLVLDAAGTIATRQQASAQTVEGDTVLNTARRTIATADGGWAMLHQGAWRERTSESGEWNWGECFPMQTSMVTLHGPRSAEPLTLASPSIAPAFDFAISPDAQSVALVGSDHERWGLEILAVDDGWACGPISDVVAPSDLPGTPTSVAFDDDGLLWLSVREPALLVGFDTNAWEVTREIALSDRSVADTGHELFHRATKSGIACASCHPEGREDGVAWAFGDEHRRSQPLAVELAGSEPFHWHGDMADLREIVELVRGDRMCGVRLGDAHADALAGFVMGLRPLRPVVGDAEAIARGAALFATSGCAACHTGDRYTNDQTVLVRGVSLQVPTLRSVAFRPPFMHDGRAETLRDAVLDMLAVSVPGGDLDDAELADVVAFLASL